MIDEFVIAEVDAASKAIHVCPKMKGGVMRIVGLFVAIIAALAIVPAANGDAVYYSQHIPLAPVAADESGSGFVENIHANGPNVFAHEEYVVRAALPLTTYSVELHVFSDAACSVSRLVAPTATIATNPAGNGSAYAVFTPADAASIRDMTVHPYWTLSTNGAVAYETACQTIQLD
jgi:hypothetical protein